MALTPKEQSAFSLLREGPEYRRYFFKHTDDIQLFLSLKQEGFFNSEYNPVPVESKDQKGFFSIPYWPALGYLEKVSQKCSEAGRAEETKGLMDITRKITRPSTGSKVDNYHTWYSFVKIWSNLPTEVISIEDIELIRDWLESKFDTSLVGGEIGKSLLPKLLKSEKSEDWKKASKIIGIVTEIKWFLPRNAQDSDEVDEPRLTIEAFWMRDLFKKNTMLLGQKCGNETVFRLKERLTEILTKQKKEREFAYIWRPAIEANEQNVGTDQPAHVLIDALRDVLFAYASSNDASSELKDLLKTEDILFKRIAVHIIDILFEKYQTLFWDSLNHNWFERFQRHEVYLLLKNNFEKFSDDKKNKIIDQISQLTGDWKEEKNRTHLDMLLRAQWMSAVANRGHGKADNFYHEYTKVLGYVPEHPEFLSFMSTSWGHERIVSVEELLSKSTVKDIVDFLNAFQGKTKWGEPADEGLGETLKLAVKTKLDLFETDLLGFLNCKPIYQYYIISALEDIWNEKKPINWIKALKLCEMILKQPGFWDRNETDKTRHFRKSWIPSAIAGLIQKGVGNDNWAFDPKLLPQAGQILEEILEKESSSAKGDREDALTEAINTVKGSALGTFFSYALRQCRVLEKGGNDRADFWKKYLKPVFDKELADTKDGNYEFSAIAGEYLPNLYYLSKDWVEKNISELFPNKDATRPQNWFYAMDGYSYVGTVNSVIYDLLKRNGDLQKVLREVKDRKRIRERVIDNICVTYLRGQEPIDGTGSLFREILEEWREEDIINVISLFWQHRDADLQREHKERIFNFWRYCYERILAEGEKQNEEVLSDLNFLTVFFDEINDEIKTWLLQSVPYVEKRWHSSFLLEYLNRLVEANPQAVGEIMIAMLKQATPNYQEEHIVSIVETLFKKNCKTLANDICDLYLLADQEFLKSIYEKWN